MITAEELAKEIESAGNWAGSFDLAEHLLPFIQSRAAGVQCAEGAVVAWRSQSPGDTRWLLTEHEPTVPGIVKIPLSDARLATPQPPKDAGALPADEGRHDFERWAREAAKRWGLNLKRWEDSGEYAAPLTRDWWKCWTGSREAMLAADPGHHPPAEPAARAQPIDEDHPENWPAWLQDLVASTAQTATDAARAQVVGYRWRNSDHQPWTLGETVSGFDLNSREIGAAIEPLGVVTSAHPSPAHAWAGDAEALAKEVWTALDKESCPGVYMQIAYETIFRRLAGGDHA